MSEKMQRTQGIPIREDLAAKMVLLVGPRQCGKTTLARSLNDAAAYYSWDVDAHRRALKESRLDPDARLWILDEIHKWRQWRNWLKGLYDMEHESHSLLVTGSARLDAYHRGGDSLQGRFFLHHLHPLTYAETGGSRPAWEHPEGLLGLLREPQRKADPDRLAALLRLGGFPEPFLSGSDRHARRWRKSYGTTLIREDIGTLEALKDLDKLELLYDRLPACVGSPLSMNALRNDLEVAFETVRNWITILERVYGVFRVPPFGPPRIKAVKKEQKLYFWDWARVEDEGARLENLVAVHLLRLCDWLGDVHGESAELRYFRDVDGHEVDFVVLLRKKPWLAVEVKQGDRGLSPGLRYLLERSRFSFACQVSAQGSTERNLPAIGGCPVQLMPLTKLLAVLP
jgi:uncharacterized protein